MIGTTLGGYRIESILSRSETGVVYKAVQLSVARVVALKVLDQKLTRDKQRLRRFIQEARTIGKLAHPRVVQVHEVGQEGAHVFYSMEYVPGGSLLRYLNRQGAIPWAQALRMFRDVLDVFVFAQQRRLLHGRLSPDYLLVARDGRVKVLDLGLGVDPTRQPAADTEAALRRLCYVAPEQIMEGTVTEAADVYAVGATFFHALTGELPFLCRSYAEVIKSKSRVSETVVQEKFAGAPEWAVELIGRMLASERSERGTFAEIAAFVEESVAADIAAEEAEARAARGSGSHLRLTILAGCALLAVTVLGVVFWGGGNPAPDPQPAPAPSPAAPVVAASDPAELHRLRERWESGALSLEDALVTAGELLSALPEDDPLRESAAALHDEIAKKQAAAVRGRAKTTFAKALSAARRGAYREAARLLAEWGEENEGFDQEIELRLEQVTAAARLEVAEVEKRAANDADAGEFAAARRRLREVMRRIPSELRSDVDDAIRRIDRRAAAASRLEGRMREIEATVKKLAANGELAAALRELEMQTKTLASPDKFATRGGALKKGIQECGGLWKRLREADVKAWASLDVSQRVNVDDETAPFFASLREALLEAAAESILADVERRGSVRSFGGEYTDLGHGRIELAYDFKSETQLRDFVAADRQSKITLDRTKGVEIVGEVRLLRGDPFHESLRVEWEVSRYDADAPNINVVLWTPAGKPVAFRRGLDDAASGSPPPDGSQANGYVLLGVGYQPRGALSPSLRAPKSDLPVLFPAWVIVMGTDGTRLHSGKKWRCLWGETLLQALKREQKVTVSCAPGSFEWQVGKRDVAADMPKKVRRRLTGLAAESRVGSVTLLTNGATVRATSLKVTGKLNPQWEHAENRRAALKILNAKVTGVEWEEVLGR